MKIPLNELIEKTESMPVMLKKASESTEGQNDSDVLNDISMVAKNHAFRSHILEEADESIRKIYLTALTALFINEENKKVRNVCFLHLGRVISSTGQEIDFEKYTIGCVRMGKSFWNDFSDMVKGDLAVCFIVDAILILSCRIQENKKSDGMELLANIIQILDLPLTLTEKAVRMSRFIMKQDQDGFFELIEADDGIPYNAIYGYFEKKTYDWVASKLEDGKDKKGQILFVNLTIQNLAENLDIDTFLADKITFMNCSFSGIKGIVSENKEVRFCSCEFENNEVPEVTLSFELRMWKSSDYKEYDEDYIFLKIHMGEFEKCMFRNCRATKSMISMEGGKIVNCMFHRCTGTQMPCSYLLQLLGVHLENNKFENCRMENCRMETATGGYVSGGLVWLENGTMKDCKFIGCESKEVSSRGSFCRYEMQIVRLINSSIEKCCFQGCSCTSGKTRGKDVESYILGYTASSVRDVDFDGCNSYHYKWPDFEGNHMQGEIEK